MEKKAKAEAKRVRRNERRQAAPESEAETTDESPAADDVDLESQVDSEMKGETS